MNKTIRASFLLLGLSMTSMSLAQSSMALEEACFMDVDLTNYIVQVIDTGSSNIEGVVTTEGASQIGAILNNEETQALLKVSEKLSAVLTACAEGRILQAKHSLIINTP